MLAGQVRAAGRGVTAIRLTILLILPVLLALLALPAWATELPPFAYQQTAAPLARGALAMQAETAVGTRDLALIGNRGVEQTLRLRTALTGRLQAEVWGGALLGGDTAGWRGTALGAGVAWLALSEREHGLALQVSAGVARDYAGAVVPRLALAASRHLGPWQLAASGVAELPLGGRSRRDAADMLFSLGIARHATAALTLGFEAAGQDLEALWDPAEAEGGARLLAGPLAAWQLAAVQVRGHAGLVWSALASRLGPAGEPGAMARLAVVW